MDLTKDTCLVITGCVSPNANVPYLALKDKDKRRRQYIDSIEYYIKESEFEKIIFCDNSGAEAEEGLFELASVYSKKFEWLYYVGDSDNTMKYGKGFSEGEIVRYVLDNSKLMASCSKFIKITGRLKVVNINSFKKLSRKNRSYFELRGSILDSRCYLARKEDYNRYLLEAYKEVDDNKGRYLEIVYNEIVKSTDKVFYPLPFALNIVGESGSSGAKYYDSFFIHALKNVKRFFTAIIWNIKGYK